MARNLSAGGLRLSVSAILAESQSSEIKVHLCLVVIKPPCATVLYLVNNSLAMMGCRGRRDGEAKNKSKETLKGDNGRGDNAGSMSPTSTQSSLGPLSEGRGKLVVSGEKAG